MIRLLLCLCLFLAIYPADAQVGFLPPVRLPFTSEASRAELADIDGDGDLDVIFATSVYPQVRVAYNDPKGSFTKFETIYQGPASDQGSRVISFAVTDFDGDGLKDVVLTELGDGLVSITTNIAAYVWRDGKFKRQAALSATQQELQVRDLSAADFNRDGKPDFIVTIPGTILEYESSGTGYQQKTIDTGDQAVGGSHVADVNGDTYPDLVVFGNSTKISLLTGNAQGALAVSKTLTASGNVFDLALGELTGDSKLEMVAISGESNPLDYFTQASDGTFTASTIARTLSSSRVVAILDTDNDGDNDILLNGNLTNGNTKTGFSVFVHSGANFTEHFRSVVAGSINSFSIGNIDDDVKLELLPLNRSGYLGFFKEAGSGEFNLSLSFRYQPKPSDGIVADFTNDGIADLALASYDDMSVAVLPGTGTDGIFGEPKFYPTPLPTRQIYSADFNEDGHLDILYSLQQWDFVPFQFQQGIGIWLSGPDGKLQTNTGILASSSSSNNVAVGDFNKDGHRDILNADAVFFGNGNGTFSYHALGLGAEESRVVDINKDGFDDLVLLTSGSPSSITTKLGRADKTFDNGISQQLTHNDFRVLAGDLDGDQVLEFITHGNVTFSILKKGSGSTYTETTVEFTKLLTKLDLTDIDGDGDLDLLVFIGQGLEQTLTIYSNQAGVLTAGTPIVLPINTAQNFEVGRVDKDPLNDLVFTSQNGLMYVFINDGVVEPTVNATNLIVSELTESSAKVSVTAGNGTRRLFVISEGNIEPPVDNTQYTADSKFGLGTKIGTSTYVVSASDQNSLVISGLKKKTTYQVGVFEFNQNSLQKKQNYLVPVTPTKSTFTTKDDQVITFTISAKVEGDPDFQLNATTTSGLPLTYSVVSGNVAITGTSVKINGPGPAKIKASQVGNNEYTATSTDASFCVNPKKPTITVESQGGGKFLLTSSRETNNQWLLNGEVVTGATSKTYQPAADGVYSVRVVFGDCSATSDPTASLITGLEVDALQFNFSPNPASNWIVVELPPNQPYSTVAVIDMNGRMHVPATRTSFDKIEVDISNLADGIYVLRVGPRSAKFMKLAAR